jgi:hypothetical protein
MNGKKKTQSQRASLDQAYQFLRSASALLKESGEPVLSMRAGALAETVDLEVTVRKLADITEGPANA